jgi:hypothetical protein
LFYLKYNKRSFFLATREAVGETGTQQEEKEVSASTPRASTEEASGTRTETDEAKVGASSSATQA